MKVVRNWVEGRELAAALAVCAVIAGAGLGASRADAQCQVLVSPTKFDPPASGVSPSYLAGRQDSVAVGGTATGRRLLVRYNYGYLVYSLASPASPTKIQTKDLLGEERYPKTGDGQTRATVLSVSADGQRAVQGWGNEGGWGTVTFSHNGSYSAGGDFAPSADGVYANTIVKSGSRYLSFVSTAGSNGAQLWVADLTILRTGISASDASKNSVPSEKVLGPVLGTTVSILKAVDGASSAYVVAASADRVTVLDVSTVGSAVPGLSSAFTSRSYTLPELGLTSGVVRSVSAAMNPGDGKLYILVEAAGPTSTWSQSTGVTLSRIEPSTGQAVIVGTNQPAPGARRTQAGSLLIPFDNDVVAVYLESLDTGGLDLHVRAGNDFSRNLASGLKFATPTSFGTIAGFRPSGGTIHLYLGRYSDGVYAASLDCTTAPTPAVAGLTAEKVTAGVATPIADNGTAFVGDEIRYKPAFSPANSTEPVTDWRFDYDYHEGAAQVTTADAGAATPFVALPDVGFTPGGPFATQLSLLGPCDPAQVPEGGSAPAPSSGAGCWTSVTTNGANTASGNPDFATSLETGDPLPGATALLTTAFEVRNALNGTGSSLAKHRINWKVPRALLKTTAMLTGGTLTDGSEGTPATTGFRWYVSTTPVGQTGDDILTLLPGCTGASCAPGLTQRGQYRYWAQVPYRNGFRTPDCPGLTLDGLTCTGDATKTLNVTDVVLGFTVPPSSFVGAAALNVSSTSARGTVTACGGTSGFTYDRCSVNGTACTEGTYSGTGLALVGDPFAGGKLTVPTPPEGSWGIRIRYSYSTTGSCPATDVAQWPAPGSAQEWAPVTVSQVQPIIKLQDVSGNSLCFGTVCDIYTGQSGRAWVYVESNGALVKDPNPPPLSWTFGNGSSSSAQGATFSYSSAGTYTVTLNGYGIPVTQDITASVQPTGGGGGGGTPAGLAVASITFSRSSPAVGDSVTISCNATGGTAPYTEYFIAFGDGQTYSGTSRSVAHVYQSAGTKSVGCTVTDNAGTSAQRVQSLTVTAGTGGACDFTVKNSQGARLQADPFTKRFYVASGEPLTFDAVNAVGAVSWVFGDGKTATGSPATNTYNITGTASKPFTIVMTAGTCTKSYGIDVDPPAGPSFGVTDADTGTALARTAGALEARAGQRLKFTATGATGAVNWAFGDGTSSTDASPEKIYAPLVDTTYVVTLTNSGASKQDSIAVKGSTGAPLTGTYTFKYADGTTVNRSAVLPNKAITFTGVDQATSYTWDFGDGTSLAQGSPREHSYSRGGTFVVKLTTARTGLSPVTTPAPFTFVVLPPPDPSLWVAGGMAYTDNGAGVKWQSDLSVHNPGATTATLSFGYVAGSSWDGASKVNWIKKALVAGETLSFTNVLKSLFHLDQGAWGVVLVQGDDIPVPPIIVSRTYNAAGAADIGTFGLSVPAMFVGAGVKPQSAEGGNVLAGLRHDAAFRTNLTVANLKDETAEVEVTFRDANGTVLGVPTRVTVEARGVKQLNSALSAAPAAAGEPIGGSGWAEPASNFSAEVTLKKGSGVYPYATVIDQGTGDSIVVTPAARPSPTYRLPGIVRVKGKNGPYWVSDIAVLNPSAKERKVTVTYSYVKSGAPGRATMSSTLTFKPWEMKVAVDFVKVWLGLKDDDPDGYASSYVDVTPAADDAAPTENLVVVGKTYTPSGEGSVGLQVDPFAYEDGINSQSSRKRIVLSGLEANDAYRTNLALFLTPGSTGNAQVDIKVLDSFGRVSKSFLGVGLNADTPTVQLNSTDLFAGLTTDDASRATIVIDNPRGTAVVGAYSTVIDNKSEDATFVAGQPAP